jgi:hypothetical protein
VFVAYFDTAAGVNISLSMSRRPARDPEKHVLDPDRGWEPVSRLHEARFGGQRKVGKDHAQTFEDRIS